LTDPLVQGGMLFLAGLVAGTLNVIAGGGSMLTLPVMIFLGLPPAVANGTNRVAILVQNIGATSSFRRRGLISAPWLRLVVLPTLLGAILGTLAALRVGDVAFQRILAVMLVGFTAWMLWNPLVPSRDNDAPPPPSRQRPLFAALFLMVGFYGGFIQAGVGFIILAATSLGGLNLIRGNAVKVALVLAYTPLSLALFAWQGKVDWAMGAALAAGNLLGALAGVRLQVLKGHRWVRGVVTITILAFAVRLLITS
jgi:uncharacterized membrane protein YfcA